MFKTLSLGGSVALRKLLWGGKRGSQAIYKFATKRTDSLNNKDYCLVTRKTRYQAKEFCVLLFMGRCKPLGLLNSFLSYAPQLSGAKPYFLTVYIRNSCASLGWQVWWMMLILPHLTHPQLCSQVLPSLIWVQTSIFTSHYSSQLPCVYSPLQRSVWVFHWTRAIDQTHSRDDQDTCHDTDPGERSIVFSFPKCKI